MKRKELISKLKSCKHDIYMSGKTTFSHNNGLIFIASFLEEVINYLATQPQQPAKELYEKVYIRSEEDLPEAGDYLIGFNKNYIGLSDDGLRYHRIDKKTNRYSNSPNEWLEHIDWYLKPLKK